ncbi:uncharacterized protein LOC132714876 [Ruditapes philippinarum]|uniref:uncharacterized protein LOC132714876 n=1 Tax=Ruditapes philippinarum TaxID=129788 RepID=UPI00295B9557|nr:uncharacterized protein LOC132714876 [Ruditapes philippinarum]
MWQMEHPQSLGLSQFGKGFLEDHEDIKSQFLGFCLKNHHNRKQEEEKLKAAEALQQSMQAHQNVYTRSPEKYLSKMMTFQSPRGQGPPPVHPVAMLRSSAIRSTGVRYEPYRQTRPPKRPSISSGRNPVLDSSFSPVKDDDKIVEQIIKIEPTSDNESTEQSEVDVLNSKTIDNSKESASHEMDATQNMSSHCADKEDDATSETSNSNLHHEQTSEGLGFDSDLTNVISGSDQTPGSENDQSDYVKMEAISESELELEITGVEPGRPAVSQESWDPNISIGMNYDNTQGAAGNQADLSSQGYSWPEYASIADQYSRPKPGIYDQEFALANGMVELVKGMRAFVHQDQYKTALSKAAPTVSLRTKCDSQDSKRDGKRVGRYLLTVFFSQEELARSSLSDSDKAMYQALNKQIVDAIVAFSVCNSDSTRVEILRAMRSSLTSKRSKGKRKSLKNENDM